MKKQSKRPYQGSTPTSSPTPSPNQPSTERKARFKKGDPVRFKAHPAFTVEGYTKHFDGGLLITWHRTANTKTTLFVNEDEIELDPPTVARDDQGETQPQSP
jgi:hypothetical protein